MSLHMRLAFRGGLHRALFEHVLDLAREAPARSIETGAQYMQEPRVDVRNRFV